MRFSFDDIDDIIERTFKKAREKSFEELERISNDHLYLTALWQEMPPNEYSGQLRAFLLHAPECIDCIDYWAIIHRKRLLEEQDVQHYADRIEKKRW